MKITNESNDNKFLKNLTKFYAIYLQHKRNNSKLGAFFILISQLQILSYIIRQYSLFWEVNKETWDELFGMPGIIYDLQNILLIGDIFDIDGWETFYYSLVILLIICCCCLYLGVIFLLVSIYINFKNGMNAIKYLIYIPQIFEKFLFFPINYILVKLAFNPDDIQYINGNTGFLVFIILMMICNIFLVVIFCIGSSTLIELKDISCAKGITIFIMDIIYKVVIIVLTTWYQFRPQKSTQWIILFTNFLFMVIVYYITYKKSIFNNTSLQTASLIIRLICCISSLMMITTGNSEYTRSKTNPEAFLIFWIILSILACTITFNMVKNHRDAFAIIFDDEINNEKDFIDKIIYLYKVFMTTNKVFFELQTIDHSVYDIKKVLAAYKFSFQKNYDKNLYLNLENLLEKINDDHYAHHLMILFELVKNLGQIITKKFPNYYIAKLFITNFFIDHCIFLKYTASFLHEIKIQGKQNFMMTAYIKYLTNKLEIQMRNKCMKPNELNIEKYMKEIKLNQKIETIMHAIIQDQLKFWNEISTEIISTKDLLKYAINCHKETQKLHKLWKFYNSTQKFMISRPYLQYFLFHLVTNAPSIKTEGYLKQYELIVKKLKDSAKHDTFDENSLKSPHNVIIIMSGNLSSLGKIIYCSRSANSELNYNHEKIIGAHIASLMPKFYQGNHDIYLKRYYDTGKSFVLNKCLLKPVMDGNGYIKPMLLNITIYPCLKEGLVFLGIMKPSTTFENVILLALDGEIQGISKDIDEVLELNNNMKNYIYDLCEEFQKIQLIFNFFTSLELIKRNIDNKNEKMRIFLTYQELIMKSSKIMPEKHHIDSIEFIRQAALQSNQDQNNLILACEIHKWEEYDKWCRLFDEFRTFGKLKFILKYDNNKIIHIKCNIQDQIYQDTSFLRLLLIDKIKIEYCNLLSIGPILRSGDFEEGLKQIPISQPLIFNKNARQILDSISIPKESLEPPPLIIERNENFEDNSLENERNTFDNDIKNNNKASDFHKFEKFAVEGMTSSKKNQYLESKIELAYKYNHIDFPTRILLIAIIGYFLAFSGLNLYIFAYNHQFNQDIITNSEIMFTSSLALRSLYDITNICTELYGIQMGYIRNDIWVDYDIEDLADFDIHDIKSRSRNYQNYVTTFSQYIYRLDKSLQDRIFQSQIRFYQVNLEERKKIPNDYQIYNILSAASLITEKFIQIGSIPYEERFNVTYPLYFLISNAFDDLYSANQLMNIVVQEAIEKQFEDAYKIIFISFTLISVLSGILLIYFIWKITRFNRILRNFVIDIIRTPQSKITSIINKLKIFNDILEKDYKDQHIKRFFKKAANIYEQIKITIKKVESKSSYQIRFSNAWQVKYTIFFAIMVGFVTAYYSLVYFEWSKQTKAQHLAINRLIFLSSRYTNLSIGIASCYIYIVGNQSFTFNNEDMGPQMEVIYKSIGDRQGFYDLFLQEDKKQFEYESWLQGNYCSTITEYQEYCVTIGHQVAETGIMGMDTFSSINLQLLKDMFDQSNRSKEAIIEIMNGLTFLEAIDIDYAFKSYAYHDFINTVKNDLDKLLLEQAQSILQILFLMALFYGPSILIFRIFIQKMLAEFYSKLKKVMRMFPIDLILSNPYLRIFLIRISNPVLGSIQNKVALNS